jgi:hypothetical protein
MKKFSQIRKIYEQEEAQVQANLPQGVTQTTITQTTTSEPNQGQSTQAQEDSTKVEQPEPQPQEQQTTATPVAFFSKLFESREMAHIYHLQVNGEEGSYAAHKALQDYYEEILDLIDELLETYQGQYGIVEGYDVIDTSSTKSTDKVEYFNILASFIKESRKAISLEDTHLHSIIDDIVVLVYQTLYKLKFNK